MFTKRNYLVGLSIFLAVWVLILAVPKTRNILRSQIDESTAYDKSLFQYYDNNSLNESEAKKYMDASNDPAVKMRIFTNQEAKYSLSRKDIINEYDKLLKQYPQNLWLIKRRLIENLYYGVKLPMDSELLKRAFPRQMNEISNADYMEYLHGIPQALEIARYGEKLEPENSFYNWMEATFLFVQDKNNLALQTLKRGARKKYFDNGYSQTKMAAVNASKVIGRSLFEEQFVAKYSTFLSDAFPISETNMAAVWQGALKEQEGNQQAALKIYSTQLQLCAQMLSSDTSLGYNNFVNNLAIDAWLSKNRYADWQKQMPKSSPGQEYSYINAKELLYWRTTTASSLFEQYAIAHNRRDLAQQTRLLAHNLYVTSDLSQYRNTDGFTNPIYGSDRMRLLFQYKWIGMQLFNSLELLVPLFLLISFPVISTLRKYPNIRLTVDQQIGFVNVISGTIFALGVFGFLLAFAMSQGVSSYYYDSFSTLSSAQIDYVKILRRYIGTYYWWIPFMACYAYCAISTLWKCRKRTFVNKIQNVLLSSIKAERLEEISKRISLAHQLAYWIIVFLIVLGLFSLQFLMINNYAYALIPLTLMIAVVVWCFTKNVHLRAPAFFTGTYWLLFATWLQRSLAMLILVFTVAYGVTSWASLPLRHEANIKLNHVLKIGDVAALREAFSKDKSQHPNQ